MRRAPTLLIAAAALVSLGSAPETWRHPEGRVGDGTAENISLTDGGAILLAPSSTEILPGEGKIATPSFLWSIAQDLKGTVFVGGGPEAQVLRLDRKGKAEPLFHVGDLGVRAIASDVAGDLFVATFPNGRIYRVSPEGEIQVYFEPEERYLWAMATDAFDRLYVASGEQGIVYAVSSRGEGRPFFDSDEAHITSLASDPSGRLIAGGSGRGLLYRLDNEGHPDVILDSRLEEISAIAVASDGTIYAAALSEPPPPQPRRPGDRANELTIEITPPTGDGILEEATEERQKVVIDLGDLFPRPIEGKEPLASQVHRVVPGRTPQVVWSSASERVYSLAIDSRGHLLIGTGPSGRLYRLEPDASITLVRPYPASQITSMATLADGRTYVLTSNPGRAHVFEAVPAPSGRYLSPIRDARNVAAWGSIRWEADTPPGTRVEIAVRTGNSPVPDESWSAWSEAFPDPTGSPIKAAPARYIQWRAELSRLKSEATPILKNVTLTYLPENLPPVVRGVVVSEPGAPKPAPPAASKGAGTAKGTAPAKDAELSTKETAGPEGLHPIWINWASSDADGDPLRHTLSVRRVEDANWKVVAREITSPPFALDPSTLAEGRCIARVEADDGELNGPERALVAEARSDPFDVDRTPPVIDAANLEEAAGTISVAFSVRDALSAVFRAGWAPEQDGEWTILLPLDGIADSRTESYAAKIPAAGAGRRIFLRAADVAGNVTILEVSLSRPR